MSKTPLKLDFNSTFEFQSPTGWNLGEKTLLKLDFLNPSFYQVRVKTLIQNSAPKLHFNSTLNSSYQLGKFQFLPSHKLGEKTRIFESQFYQVRVKTRISKLHFNSTFKLQYHLDEIWVNKLDINSTFWIPVSVSIYSWNLKCTKMHF